MRHGKCSAGMRQGDRSTCQRQADAPPQRRQSGTGCSTLSGRFVAPILRLEGGGPRVVGCIVEASGDRDGALELLLHTRGQPKKEVHLAALSRAVGTTGTAQLGPHGACPDGGCMPGPAPPIQHTWMAQYGLAPARSVGIMGGRSPSRLSVRRVSSSLERASHTARMMGAQASSASSWCPFGFGCT